MKNPSTQTLFATLTLDACSMQILNDLHVPDAFIARVHTGTEKLEYVSLEPREKASPGGGGEGTPLFGLYGYVPLDRVWFFGLAVLNRVYNLTCLCPNQV